MGHDDVIMKNFFNKAHPDADVLGHDDPASMGDYIQASYVHCAVGNYCEHVSGCEPAYAAKPRPASWDAHWAQEWTHGGQERVLCRFTKNGKGDVRPVCEINLDPACMAKLVWKSLWEDVPAPDGSHEGEVAQGQKKKKKRRDRELRKIERFNSLRCPPSWDEVLG